MNLPKKFIAHVFVFIFIASSSLCAQKDSTKKRIRFSVNIGLIVNSTFSGFEKFHYDNNYPNYALYLTKVKGAPEYSAGYLVGMTAICGKSLKYNLILGATFSSTKSQRHESYYNEPHELGPEYYHEHSELDFSTHTLHTNIELGFRVGVFKNFFLQPSFLIHYNLQTTEKQAGIRYIEQQHVDYSVFPHIWNFSQATEQINKTTINHSINPTSLRFTVF